MAAHAVTLKFLMPRSRKKAVIRSLAGDWTSGYLPFEGFLQGGNLDLLALDGKMALIPACGVKWVAWIRDFNSGDIENPERLLRKTFAGKPRMPGLVIRLGLSDGDVIEGLAGNNISFVADDGILLVPPDIRSNTQRLWIPRSTVATFEALAVIGAPKIGSRPAPTPHDEQKSLF